jgi:hypothetical protein
MFNPVIAILFNAATKRWHPVVFVQAPLPGPDRPDKPIRHLSRMHHTEGFGTRAEALDDLTNSLRPRVESIATGRTRVATEVDLVWDGQRTPLLNEFFTERDGKLFPLLCATEAVLPPKV